MCLFYSKIKAFILDKQNPNKQQTKHTSRKGKTHQKSFFFSKTDTANAEMFPTTLLDLCSGNTEQFSWFHPQAEEKPDSSLGLGVTELKALREALFLASAG